MASKAELALILSLVDDVTDTAKRVKGDLGDVGKEAQGAQGFVEGLGKVGFAVLKAGAIVAAAAITAATTAMVAIGKAAWDAATQVDEAMDTIIITTGATGEELAGLESSFKTVLGDFPASAADVSEAIAGINQTMEMTGKPLEDLTKGILALSKLTKTDAKTNVTNFSRVMGDWGIENEHAQGTLDQLFTTTQLTGIGIEDLMSKVVQFGSPLRLMGFTLEESMIMFGKFQKEGVNAELVMGSMRIAAGKFAKAGQPLKESLMGIFDSIKLSTDASAALALGMEVFGAKAGPDMVAAIREGRFSIEELTSALDDSQDALEFTMAATADWPEVMQIVKNKITLALEPIGTKFLDLAKMVLEKFLPVFEDKIVPFFNDNLMPVFTALADAIAILLTGDYAGAIDALLPDDVVERWKTISPIFGGLAGIIKTALQGLTGMNVWEDITEFDPATGVTVTPGLKTYFEALGKDILAAIGRGLADIKQLALAFTQMLIDWQADPATRADIAQAGYTAGGQVIFGITQLFGAETSSAKVHNSLLLMIGKAFGMFTVNEMVGAVGFAGGFWKALFPNSEQVRTVVDGFFQTIRAAAWGTPVDPELYKKITQAPPGPTPVAEFFRQEWAAMLLNAHITVSNIENVFEMAWLDIKQWFDTAVSDTTKAIAAIGVAVSDAAGAIYDAIIKPFVDAWNNLLDVLFPTANSDVEIFIKGLGITISNAAADVYSAITKPFVDAWNWIRANIPGMGGVPVQMPQIPSIPQVPTIPVIPPTANNPRGPTTPYPFPDQTIPTPYTPPMNVGPGGTTIPANYTLIINTSAPSEDIIADFSLMNAMAGA
jgi:hypothetical protein